MQKTFRHCRVACLRDTIGRSGIHRAGQCHAGCDAWALAQGGGGVCTQEATKTTVTAFNGLRRADREQTLALWNALFTGGWSIAGSVDAEGRHVLLLERSELAPAQNLSRREVEVLALAARGESNKCIGFELGIAPSTVSTTLRTAMLKLGVQSRVALSRWYASKKEAAR